MAKYTRELYKDVKVTDTNVEIKNVLQEAREIREKCFKQTLKLMREAESMRVNWIENITASNTARIEGTKGVDGTKRVDGIKGVDNITDENYIISGTIHV